MELFTTTSAPLSVNKSIETGASVFGAHTVPKPPAGGRAKAEGSPLTGEGVATATQDLFQLRVA